MEQRLWIIATIYIPVATWHRVAHGKRVGHLKVVAEALVHQEFGALECHRGHPLGQSVEFLDSAGVQRRNRGLGLRWWGRRPSIRGRRLLST